MSKFIRDYIKGFKTSVTLMELVVAISIIGFILVAVITYNLIGEKFYHSTSKQSVLLNDAQYLIEQMGKDIKQATDVDSTGSEATIYRKFGGDVTYTYQEDERKIYCNDELFASNVVLFNVDTSDIGNSRVTVELKLEIEEEGTKLQEESHYVATFFLRNREE